MAVVKVSKLNTETAPKSASVSINARAMPAPMAGRAIGSATRQNACNGDSPSTLAASIRPLP
ncbi:MAG: hypothetical protein GAK45_02274 [Pseudomonas citronellolis]|nr:MAG: hypothetical protein GAK45_02274 [Pseudomonas citronellolis]